MFFFLSYFGLSFIILTRASSLKKIPQIEELMSSSFLEFKTWRGGSQSWNTGEKSKLLLSKFSFIRLKWETSAQRSWNKKRRCLHEGQAVCTVVFLFISWWKIDKGLSLFPGWLFFWNECLRSFSPILMREIKTIKFKFERETEHSVEVLIRDLWLLETN